MSKKQDPKRRIIQISSNVGKEPEIAGNAG